MSHKKSEDVERGVGEAKDFAEKDPFLGRTSPVLARAEPAAVTSKFWDTIDHSPGISILAYCLASISMTVVNKYVVSGDQWNLMFFYLAIQVRPPAQPMLRLKQRLFSKGVPG